MEELEERRNGSPWINAVLIILISLLGFLFIGPLIGFFIALPFYDGSVFDFIDDLGNPLGNENVKLPLFIVQGAATLIGLAIIPAFYWFKSNKKSVFSLVSKPHVTALSLLAVACIVIFFMGFNSIFIEWNSNLHFPDFLSGFESWARDLENRAAELTKFLTTFDSFGQFLVGFVVIAILPAVGEELVFRGMIQPELQRATKNIHAAIWISAILFSSIHMQFFGFVPRVLLGALFGYLYHWSGNLIVPITAHFVNNGFSVLMIYFNQTNIAGVDLENAEAAPWRAVIISTALTGFLLYYFKKTQTSNSPPA